MATIRRRTVTRHRRNGVTGLSASVERDDLSGGWAVYLHDGRRTLNMTDDYFASKAGAEREAKKMLAQARAGVPLDTLAAMFYEAHVAPSRRAERELANPRRRRTVRRRRNSSHYDQAKELMAVPVAEIDALSDADFFSFLKLCERVERVLRDVGEDDPQGAISPASAKAGQVLTGWIDRVLVPRIPAREASYYAAPKKKKKKAKTNRRRAR